MSYSYDVNATDADGDTLTYSLTQNPSGMTINGTSGVISWTPSSAGSFDVTVSVSDGNGGTDTQSYSIAVTSGGTGQMPWQTNENGTLITDQNWNYTLGYHFVPETNGNITQLGGYFNGTKTGRPACSPPPGPSPSTGGRAGRDGDAARPFLRDRHRPAAP